MSEASGADLFIIPRLLFLLGLGIVFVFAWAYVCTFSPMRLRGPGNLLNNILFCLPAVEVAMPIVKQILRKRDKQFSYALARAG